MTILPAPLILLLLSGIVFYKASQLVRRWLKQEINELKDTRTTRDKYYHIKTNSDELITLLKNENRDLCTAFHKLNKKMSKN